MYNVDIPTKPLKNAYELYIFFLIHTIYYYILGYKSAYIIL